MQCSNRCAPNVRGPTVKLMTLTFLIVAMATMAALLGAMSTVAAAHESSPNLPPDLALASATRLTGARAALARTDSVERAPNNKRRRAKNTCARITGTCWRAA